MDCLASQLWAKYSPTFKKSNERQWDNDPVTYSLNCWPGELAYFWIAEFVGDIIKILTFGVVLMIPKRV